MIPYNKKLKQISRNLRNKMTDAEIKLWSRLKSKQIDGNQFYRQRIIGQYIVDFCCLKTKLVIEVDGSQHYSAEGQKADNKRDNELVALGFRIVRFNDLDVLKNIDGVLEYITEFIREPIIPSVFLPDQVGDSLLLKGRGEYIEGER
ncbi:MAG: DUF559 domain-containing protein [Dehalococcoidales bacterium]|nr:DUF559 domain-containing protein [Dehalococcoidales bacterium]